MGLPLGSQLAQSPSEFLGVLLGLRLFARFFRGRGRIPLVKADAAAALGAATKPSSPPAFYELLRGRGLTSA